MSYLEIYLSIGATISIPFVLLAYASNLCKIPMLIVASISLLFLYPLVLSLLAVDVVKSSIAAFDDRKLTVRDGD